MERPARCSGFQLFRRSEGGADPTREGTKDGREWPGVVLVGLLVLAFCGVLLLVNGRQWFWFDDFQDFYTPAYYDVGRAWCAGDFPLLSPYDWHGGALAGEFQFGVFSVFLT